MTETARSATPGRWIETRHLQRRRPHDGVCNVVLRLVFRGLARLCGWLLFWVLFASCGAAAQPPAGDAAADHQAPLPEVRITTDTLDPKALKNVIIPHFVRSHGLPSPEIGQVARWQLRACPWTMRLQPENNTFVSDRIMQVAARVGAPGGRCNRNVAVVFTGDRQCLLDALVRDHPWVLGYGPRRRLPTQLRFTRPIEAWQATVTRYTSPPGPIDGAEVLDPQGYILGCHLRFTECIDSFFNHAVVIADARRVTGHTLGQIATTSRCRG